MSKKIFVAVLFLFIFSFNSSLAFWQSPTHRELTREIIKVYNQSVEIKISQEQADWIIDGSIKEDAPPRWINHFYDPVLNQGWSGERQGDISKKTINLLSKIFLSIKDATSSINWAFDQKLQEKYSLYQGDQTYSKAVQAYVFSGLEEGSAAIKPDYATFENAFKALGHVLHLIEDLGVPAHTRNDTHAGINESINDVDPYEQWAAEAKNINFDNFKNIKGGVSCSDTKDCFIKLAKYSNENFYSKDTIDDPKYKKLENESLKIIGDKTIYFRHDNFGNLYPFKIFDQDNHSSISDPIIYQAYWNLLSKQVVLTGIQVINNFFKDAQESAQNVDFQASITKIDIPSVPMVSVYGETEKAKGAIGSFWDSAVGAVKNALSSVGEFFSGLFGNQNDFTQADQISLTDSSVQNEIGSGSAKTNNPVVSENSQIKSLKSEVSSLKKDIVSLKKDLSMVGNSGSNSSDSSSSLSVKKSNSQKTTIDKNSTSSVVEKSSDSQTEINPTSQAAANCFYNSSQTPSRNKVLINEVAWMGSTVSANDEWIELKNISNQNIDLSNWQIINKGRQIEINLSQLKNKNLASGGFILLERTDDNSVPNVKADLIYTGALSNSDEGLRLFDGACNLMDEILTGSSWSAGDNYLKKTMERNGNDFGWHTSAYVGGTPKAENSVVYGGGGGAVVVNNSNQNLNNLTQSNFNSTSTASTTDISSLNLKITEVVYDFGGANETDKGKEYVKIFNFGDNDVNLSSFSLQYQYLKEDGNLSEFKRRNFEEGNLINSQGYFKIGVNCSVAIPCEDVDLSWRSQALNNTNGTIFLVSNQETISSMEDNDIIDVYYYPPQQADSYSTTSSVLAGLAAVFVKDSMRIDLSWQAVTSTDSSRTEIGYRITDASSSAILNQSSSTSASITIDEVGRNYDFLVEAIGASSSVLASATTTVSAPSFLSDLYFYKDPRNQNDYLVEGKYSQYPIAPSLYAPDGWKVIVFYLNSESPKQMYIENPFGDGYNWNWLAEDFSKVIGVRYVPCASTGGESRFKALILADTPQRCNGLGIGTERFAISSLGINKFFVPLEKTADQISFSASDYITTGYYSFYSSSIPSGGPEVFKLVAVDKTKYYFGEESVHEAPQLMGSINLVFDQQNSKLAVDWPKASDSDTVESLLGYEIRYNDSGEWQAVYATGTVKDVTSGDDFSISVRAKDEFGVTSSALTANWKYPEINFEIIQTQADSWSYPFGPDFASNGCFNKSLQSIIPEKDFQFDKVVLKIIQGGDDSGDIRLSVYKDNGSNQPDFGIQLGNSILPMILRPSQDLVFKFNSPISLLADHKYWLVLDISGYSSGDTYERRARNQWQSAVSKNNPYSNGETYMLTSCSISVYPPNADWYMKIGQ
ncbi:MAG: lamin tail domain-containing protein [Patescibacteria group bacterium]